MNKYRVYFKNGRIEIIYGYSQQDAILRYGIKMKDVECVNQTYGL